MKRLKLTFNNLLRRYLRYTKKLQRFRLLGRNEHRQRVLEKHIQRLETKLSSIQVSIKKGVLTGAVVAGALLATTTANAQATFQPTGFNNPFEGLDVGLSSNTTFADVDGDGDLDMVSGEYYGTFFYFENDGGVYTQQTGANNPFNGIDVGNRSSPTFADVDGDGDLDMLSGESNGTFLYFENDGGVYTQQTGANNPFNGIDVGIRSRPTFADVDGDGDLDMLSGEAYGTFLYFENDGGVYTQQTGANNPFNGFDIGHTSTPAFADVDGDGDLDMLSGELYGIFFYFKNVGGVFTQQTGANNPFDGFDVGTVSSTTFADVDGDGDLDMLSGEYQGSFFYFENENGVFTQQTGNNDLFEGLDLGYNSTPAFADLDGDGDLDMISGEYNRTFKYFQNNAGVFTEQTGNDNPFNGIGVGRTSTPNFADLDDDGDLDMLSGEFSGEFFYFQNNGGTFTLQTGGNNPFDGFDVGFLSAPTFADVDGDGDLDMLSGQLFGTFFYFENNAGVFTQQTGSNNPFDGIDVGSNSTPSFGDVDGDGDPDMLSGEGNGIFKYFQNSVGIFTEQTGANNPFDGFDVGTRSSTTFADVDGDGDLDLISGNRDGEFILFYNTTPRLEFIWESGTWAPSDPSGVATTYDTIEVRSAGATLTATAATKDLTITSIGALDLGAITLNVSKDISAAVGGSLDADQATLNLVGTAAQQVTGDFQVRDLVIKNTSTHPIALNSNVEVMNRLDLISGDLDTTGGILTLNSDATNTAMVDVVGKGKVTGAITVEQFIPAKRVFRFLSSTVNTATSINANWQEGMNNAVVGTNTNPNPGFGTHITGSDSGSNGFDATGTGNPSLFTFSNTGQTWDAVSNTDATTLVAGDPYRLFVRGSRAIDLNDNSSTPDPTTLRTTGTIVTGDVTQSDFSATAGIFNFFGNPYQSSVDMNMTLAASTNINTNFYYVWDPQQGQRGAYVTVALPAGTNTSGSAANQYVQPGQAAFVTTQTNAAASMLFQEAHKAVGQRTATFSAATASSSIIGQLFRNENGTVAASMQDSYGIFFNSSSNTGVDSFDAVKLPNQDETIAVHYGNNFLAVDNRQLPQNNETIQLSHSAYRTANYQYKIVLTDIIGKQVFLEDAFLGTRTLLNDGENLYDFNVDVSTNSSATDRFSLAIENETLGLGDQELASNIAIFPNPVSSDVAEISLNGQTLEGDARAVIYNLSGQRLFDDALDFSNGTYQINGLSRLATGTYLLEITSAGSSQTIKFVKQ
jgi:hypothetical protein